MTSPDFFVGYLPMPRRLRRFALLAAAASLALVLGAGFVLARSTSGGGRAQFRGGASKGIVGVVTAHPTAMLWTLDPAAPGGVRGTLLVRQGKFGANMQAEALDGKVVRVDGANIERDGRRMIELTQPLAQAELPEAERAQILSRAQSDLGRVTLEGEIVDSKCWLGRMRPGDRRTHRACAQLCIAGGIPPMFVANDGRAYLLADDEGSPIQDAILPFVAEPVRVTGHVVAEADVLILRTSAAQIVRM